MRFLLCILLCFLLTGCAYGSMNVIRAQGHHITLLGYEGYIDLQDASITIDRTMNAKTKSMIADTNPYGPQNNYSENGPASNVAIGSPVTAARYTTQPSTGITLPVGWVPTK